MLRGDYSVTIARPPEVVFDLIAEGTRNPSWRGAIVEVTRLRGDGGVGTVWHQLVRGFGGRLAEADYRVTVCQRPLRYAFVLTAGPTLGGAEYTLTEESPGQTRVSVSIELRGRGLVQGLSGLARRQMAIELDALDRLERVLTAPDGGAG